ncbi:MAG: peptidase M48 Ste24p, partial [Sphingomonas sp.]|nr:peptidase M48 Ste24p [Sphingomonas sp.]
MGSALAVLAAIPAPAQQSPARQSSAQQAPVQPITPQERAQGTAANGGIVDQFGGAYTGRQNAYVEAIARKVAVRSGLSTDPNAFTVTVLDSPIDNAFAVPGGYVYVTRGLLALANDEAELAGVLGHEVGHVAARHSRKRESAATRNAILAMLGQMAVGAVIKNTNVSN